MSDIINADLTVSIGNIELAFWKAERKYIGDTLFSKLNQVLWLPMSDLEMLGLGGFHEHV